MTGRTATTRRSLFAGAALALPVSGLLAGKALAAAPRWTATAAAYRAAVRVHADACSAEDLADTAKRQAEPPLPPELIREWRMYRTEKVFIEELRDEAVIQARFATAAHQGRRERALAALQAWRAERHATPAWQAWVATEARLDDASDALDAAFSDLLAYPAPNATALAIKAEAIIEQGCQAEHLRVLANDARRLGRDVA